MGPVPIEPYYVNDVGDAAPGVSGPDLRDRSRRVRVPGGAASLLQCHPNVTVSLEATSALLFKAPWKFAEIIGTLMDVGAADRIIWGLGGAAIHSRAFEANGAFEFPEELQARYGLPPLTEEARRGILGENAARMLGLDIAEFRRRTHGDEFAKPRELGMVVSWRGASNARERGHSGVSGSASEADPLRATADATWRVLEGIVNPCSRAVGAPVGLVSLGLVLDLSVMERREPRS